MLGNIENKYILTAIFEFMRNKKKLNIIRFNKRIKEKLNIKKEDYKVYELLEEFNKKYNLNIEDIDIKELNLNESSIGNEGLKYLNKIKFKELNVLNLNTNKISDISILVKVNFKKLNGLYLSNNKINKQENSSLIKYLESKINKISI